jgi:lipopolysaccharide/colanic/teichoic acid biosynthesis glycosyltransferase
VALDLLDPTIQGATLGYFGELPTINYAGRGGWLYEHVLKRAFDVLFSLVVVVLMVIPGAILCLVIALQSKGSPFYTQRRVGQGGRHFNLYKFRSMVADADDVEKHFTPEQLAEWERERKVEGDPRITAVGRILRKTSLDEFPQFLNVLKGDMSVVGPRPIVDEELVHYGEDLDEFLSCKPGITGWWQVEARNDATYADGSRQQLELYYARHASATLDWNIILRTVGAVFEGTGK